MKGIIPLALAITIIGFSGAGAQVVDTTKHEKAPVVQNVGTYPAFTNYSVQTNPAFPNSGQIGQEWGVELGKNGGERSAIVSMRKDIGSATVSFSIGTSANKSGARRSGGANLSVPLANGVLVGGNVAATTTPDGKTKNSGCVGAFGIYTGNGYFVRAGIAEDIVSNSIHWSAEWRQAILGMEGTVTSRVTAKDGKVADKGIGAQVKRGPFLLSAGKGGEGWKDTKLHARISLEKMRFDFHVQGRGSQVSKNPTLSVRLGRNIN